MAWNDIGLMEVDTVDLKFYEDEDGTYRVKKEYWGKLIYAKKEDLLVYVCPDGTSYSSWLPITNNQGIVVFSPRLLWEGVKALLAQDQNETFKRAHQKAKDGIAIDDVVKLKHGGFDTDEIIALYKEGVIKSKER